jgi:hypothetical protein
MKFKVWDNENKKFIDPSKATSVDEMHFLTHDGKIATMGENVLHVYTQFLLPVFFTGVSDKNGVELFDGDIIDLYQKEFPGEHHVKEILFTGGAWRSRSVVEKLGNEHLKLLRLLCDTISLDYVKIGSKFENPELLEE